MVSGKQDVPEQVHKQGAFRRHFAQLVKERKQECLCTSVSTFLLQVVNGLR